MDFRTKIKEMTFDKTVLFVVGLVLSLFHLTTALLGPLPSYQHRVVHLILGMALVPFMYQPGIKNSSLKRQSRFCWW